MSAYDDAVVYQRAAHQNLGSKTMSNKTGSNHAFSKMGLGLLACCVLAAIGGGAGAAERGLSGEDLVYSYDEMFDFDIDAYLAKNAPHL
ncbi:hypothetical protein AB4084_07440, partial [Lysobacter sp. 2RAB21]